MPQPASPLRERRIDVRRPAAFPFWITSVGGTTASAWMLNLSDGGAAFLVARNQAPQVGERLVLAEMFCRDSTVQAATPPLPPRARVLRIEDDEGTTRRVAVRFEPTPRKPLAHRRARRRDTGFLPDPGWTAEAGWTPEGADLDHCLAGATTSAR
jgi:hypothetical protein